MIDKLKYYYITSPQKMWNWFLTILGILIVTGNLTINITLGGY